MHGPHQQQFPDGPRHPVARGHGAPRNTQPRCVEPNPRPPAPAQSALPGTCRKRPALARGKTASTIGGRAPPIMEPARPPYGAQAAAWWGLPR